MLCISVGCLKALEEIGNDTIVLLLLLFWRPWAHNALHKAASPAAAVSVVWSNVFHHPQSPAYVPGALRGQKRTLDHLDLELGMVVSHHRVLGLELSPFSTVYMSRDNRDLYPFFISSFFKAFVYFLYCICLYFLKFYVYLCFTHICACGPCVFSACDDHKRV